MSANSARRSLVFDAAQGLFPRPPKPGEDRAIQFVATIDEMLDAVAGEVDPDRIWAAAETAAAHFGPGWLTFARVARDPLALLSYRSGAPAGFLEGVAAEGLIGKDYIAAASITTADPFLVEIGVPGGVDAPMEERAPVDAFLARHGVRFVLAHPFHGLFYASAVVMFLTGAPDRTEIPGPLLRRFSIFACVLRAHYDPSIDPAARPPYPGRGAQMRLTAREVEALRLSAEGFQTARVAERMGISEAGAKKHLAAARRKLGARTREEAVARAARLGLLPAAEIRLAEWTPTLGALSPALQPLLRRRNDGSDQGV